MLSACLLLSGGMDSIALAYWIRPMHAVTIDYGQLPASAEIRAAQAVCGALDIQHHIVPIDGRPLGAGDMAGSDRRLDVAPTPEWWPFRNQLLITLAAAKAVQLGCAAVMIGTVAGDSIHADGSPNFLHAMSSVLQMQEGGITLIAPAAELTTLELIKKSQIPQSILGWGFSCHASEIACGRCRGCQKRKKTWLALEQTSVRDGHWNKHQL